jgi:hypothetical protein
MTKARLTAREFESVRRLYEQRYSSVDIADKPELPDRIVKAAILAIRTRPDVRVTGKRARQAWFWRKAGGTRT